MFRDKFFAHGTVFLTAQKFEMLTFVRTCRHTPDAIKRSQPSMVCAGLCRFKGCKAQVSRGGKFTITD